MTRSHNISDSPPLTRRELLRGAVAAAYLGAVSDTASVFASSETNAGSITDVAGIKVGHFTDTRRPTGCTVILTDDGVATGFTAQAGIETVRRRGAQRVVLAVPVAPPDTLAWLRPKADEVVCLTTPEPFYAVGNFFEEWPQVTDDEVRALLLAGNTL